MPTRRGLRQQLGDFVHVQRFHQRLLALEGGVDHGAFALLEGEAFLFGLRAGVLTATAASAVFDAVLLPPGGVKTPDSRVWLLFAALLFRLSRASRLAPNSCAR